MTALDTKADRTRAPSVVPCPHEPPCPAADSPNREAAHLRATHPEQGWSLLCNGIVVFDDTGELLPDGRVVEPRRSGRPTTS